MPAPTSQYQRALEFTLTNVHKQVFKQNTFQHPIYETVKRNFKSESGGDGMELDIILGNVKGSALTDKDATIYPEEGPDIATTAKYKFDNIEAGQVTINFLDLEKNSDPKNRTASKLEVHKQDLVQQFHVGLVEGMHAPSAAEVAAAGTTTTLVARPRGYLSLNDLTDDAVTGVGGIDHKVAGNERWSPLTVNSAETNPERAIRKYVQQYKIRTGGLMPDKVHVGLDVWNAAYEYANDRGSLDTLNGSAEFGWRSLKFAGVELVEDYECAPKRALFLHTPSLYFRYLRNNFMRVLEAERVRKVGSGANANRVGYTQTWSYGILSILTTGTTQRRALGQLNFTGI